MNDVYSHIQKCENTSEMLKAVMEVSRIHALSTRVEFANEREVVKY